MISNLCKIDKGSKDLIAIFKESEKVAVYNGLDHKQTLQLRLLCEELDGMLPKIVEDFDGELWFEFYDGVCEIKASITSKEMTIDKKENLISIAKNNKNAAAVGIVGKIRCAIEDFLLDEENLQAISMSSRPMSLTTGYSGVDCACLWSLKQYKNSVKKEQKDAWDELEKSVIASVADDVTVGVKGKTVDIVITKKFA